MIERPPHWLPQWRRTAGARAYVCAKGAGSGENVLVMELVDPEEPLAWVRQASSPGEEWTGFEASGWPAAAWILHAMYETDELPGSLTHDDEFQIARAAGADPRGVRGAAIDAIVPDIHAIGAPLGPSSAPGSGWRRLLWTELGSRLGTDPLLAAPYPGINSFPFRSWPSNIRPPGEGALDLEQMMCLLEHLTALSGSGCECYAYFARLPTGRLYDTDRLVVYRGQLADVLEVYDNDEIGAGPANLWPADRSWFTFTDWDLWGTKVSGSPELIAALVADTELEAVEHNFPNELRPE